MNQRLKSRLCLKACRLALQLYVLSRCWAQCLCCVHLYFNQKSIYGFVLKVCSCGQFLHRRAERVRMNWKLPNTHYYSPELIIPTDICWKNNQSFAMLFLYFLFYGLGRYGLDTNCNCSLDLPQLEWLSWNAALESRSTYFDLHSGAGTERKCQPKEFE